MRLFLSEYLCSGALAEEDLPPTLLAEGRAMRDAIISDFARIDGVEVVTTCDPRLPEPAGGKAIPVSSKSEERQVFKQLCHQCDAAYVIAPEFEGILADRCQIAGKFSARPLNSARDAVDLASDKLALSRCLTRAGIPTIPTELWATSSGAASFPCVIKPRDGAGSQSTFVCRSPGDLSIAREAFFKTRQTCEPIVQPFVSGSAVSVAAIISGHTGQPRKVFPVLEQLLTDDDRFTYLGGRIPGPSVAHNVVTKLVQEACSVVPGLRGYVGFDLIVPESGGGPLLVEINPRLTTSYVAYRRLSLTNLAESVLNPEVSDSIEWSLEPITFRPDGQVERGTGFD